MLSEEKEELFNLSGKRHKIARRYVSIDRSSMSGVYSIIIPGIYYKKIGELKF